MEAVMKFLFDDEAFSFETLRAAGFAAYGGADLGEVLVTAAAITDGDEASWHRAWKATAERVQQIGEQALAAGRPCCAPRTTTAPPSSTCARSRPPTPRSRRCRPGHGRPSRRRPACWTLRPRRSRSRTRAPPCRVTCSWPMILARPGQR